MFHHADPWTVNTPCSYSSGWHAYVLVVAEGARAYTMEGCMRTVENVALLVDLDYCPWRQQYTLDSSLAWGRACDGLHTSCWRGQAATALVAYKRRFPFS